MDGTTRGGEAPEEHLHLAQSKSRESHTSTIDRRAAPSENPIISPLACHIAFTGTPQNTLRAFVTFVRRTSKRSSPPE